MALASDVKIPYARIPLEPFERMGIAAALWIIAGSALLIAATKWLVLSDTGIGVSILVFAVSGAMAAGFGGLLVILGMGTSRRDMVRTVKLLLAICLSVTSLCAAGISASIALS